MVIEFELNTPEQWLLGVYRMDGEAHNEMTNNLEIVKCLQIGILFFTISIFF